MMVVIKNRVSKNNTIISTSYTYYLFICNHLHLEPGTWNLRFFWRARDSFRRRFIHAPAGPRPASKHQENEPKHLQEPLLEWSRKSECLTMATNTICGDKWLMMHQVRDGATYGIAVSILYPARPGGGASNGRNGTECA
jgi:hypothetical protein